MSESMLAVLLICAQAVAPKPGTLGTELKVEWTQLSHLEALVSAVETEGYLNTGPKEPRKIGFATFGKYLDLTLDPKLVFNLENTVLRERDFYFSFYGAYQRLDEAILTQAKELIKKQDLLPKVKEFDDEKGKWIDEFLKKYPSGKPIGLPKDATEDAKERAAIASELALVLPAVRENLKIAKECLRRDATQVSAEIERRKKVTENYVKRYRIEPLAYGTNKGASVIEVHLDPSIIQPIKGFLREQRVTLIATAEGKTVQVNGVNLYWSNDLRLSEIKSALRDLTHEYFHAFYREKSVETTKLVLQVVGARLLKERVWFLIYDERVVLMSDGAIEK